MELDRAADFVITRTFAGTCPDIGIFVRSEPRTAGPDMPYTTYGCRVRRGLIMEPKHPAQNVAGTNRALMLVGCDARQRRRRSLRGNPLQPRSAVVCQNLGAISPCLRPKC
jgi:hypothetical protein